MNILFLCYANSVRSQMAEGLAKAMLGDDYLIESAGARPASYVHPEAIAAMKEVGIDISKNKSKGIDKVDLSRFDVVITLCNDDVCPPLPDGVKGWKWPIPDPTGEGSPDGFREARDLIKKLIQDRVASNEKTKI